MPGNKKQSEEEPARELRRMNREELIEIIYALQQSAQALQQQNEELSQQLEERTIRIEEAGTIAEAALSLNHIFESAQAAADQYLESVKSNTEEEINTESESNAESESEAEAVISSAQAEAERILKSARAEADLIIQESQQRADEIIQEGKERAKETEEKVVKSVTAFFRKNPKLALEWERERANPGTAIPQAGSNGNSI